MNECVFNGAGGDFGTETELMDRTDDSLSAVIVTKRQEWRSKVTIGRGHSPVDCLADIDACYLDTRSN